MLKTLKNNKGSSTIVGTLAVMVLLAAASVSVVNLSGTDTKSYNDSMQGTQAMAVGNAGIQWALDKLNQGQSPDVTDKPFEQGTFTVTSDPTSSLITVVSKVGDAKKTQRINADFSYNCVKLDVSKVTVNDDTLQGLKFVKSCNDKAVLDKIVLKWNWSRCARDVGCMDADDVSEASDNYANYQDPEHPGKILICHVPPGNPNARHTLSVDVAGWKNGHKSGTGKRHRRDYLGPCDGDGAAGTKVVCSCQAYSGVSAALDACSEDDGDALITKEVLAGSTIFQAGAVPDSGAVAAGSGVEIDVVDAVMTSNGEYVLDTLFDERIPAGGWYEITAVFADGSELYGQFRAGYAASPTDESLGADGFAIENGTVKVDAQYDVTLQVLGSAITCGPRGPSINVRSELCLNGSCEKLWGYSDLAGGESYSTTSPSSNSQYKIKANAYLESCNDFSVIYDSTNTLQVKTLVNGEKAPPLAGFGGQKSVQDFLAPYLDADGRVAISSNQVIMLFELGTDLSVAPHSPSADFQDLVMLMTISKSQGSP